MSLLRIFVANNSRSMKRSIPIASGFLIFLIAFFSQFSLKAQKNIPSLLAAVQKDGKWGYIDSSGKVAIPFYFDEALPFSEGCAAVRINKSWGFIRPTGNWLLKPVFMKASSFHDELAQITYYDAHDSIPVTGYITHAGVYYFQLDPFETGGDFRDYRVLVFSANVNGRAYGYKDTVGEWSVKPRYDLGLNFSEGIAAVAIGNDWGFIDQSGKELVVPQYDQVSSFSDSMAYARKGKQILFINPKGETVLRLKYEKSDFQFSEGLLAYGEDGKTGFCDIKGKKVIKPAYDNSPELCRFHDGLAPVALKKDDKLNYGYIDHKGREVTDMVFQEADIFLNGFALVKQNDKYGFIDTKGKWLVKPEYTAARSFTSTDYHW
jgi:hypothetical protein